MNEPRIPSTETKKLFFFNWNCDETGLLQTSAPMRLAVVKKRLLS